VIELDRHQRAAVHAAPGAATNVVAGAGTGKTTVLVDRFLKLVRADGLEPDRILALTFTLKAAAEMRQRVRAAVAESMPERVEELHGAWIMNFHQFGLRLIRENAPAFGVDPDVDVVTPAEHRRIEQVLKRRFVEGRIEGVDPLFGGEMPAPTKMESRFDLFFKIALECRSDGFDAARLQALCTEGDAPGYLAYVDAVVAVARAYDGELRRRNLIDFSDMITIPSRGLEADARLRERYASRFDHILVDEFQDTSRAQNELVRVLSGGEFAAVTVVGDRKQSIYRWRDARVENIRDFPGDESPLRRNYRSRQNVLDLAHAFICTDPEFADSTDAVPLEAHRGAGDHPVVLFHPASDEDWESEAEALAVWVRHVTEGLPAAGLGELPPERRLGYGDVTVLLRSLKPGHGLPGIERAFERHRIPYAVVGGANAAETRALDVWHAGLSLLCPGARARELLTVLESEPWCFPDSVLAALVHDVKRRPGGLDLLSDEDIAGVDDPAAAERLREVRSMFEELRSRLASDDLQTFVAWALEESALALSLFARGSTPRAVEDLVLEVMESLASSARGGEAADLAGFLDHLRAAIDDKKFREESDVRLPANRVRVMTVHQAKGLEFPAVAVAGIKPPKANSDGYYLSHERGVFFSAKDKAHWGRGLDATPESEYEKRMAEQEERCLLYVAMTRAEDYLWVSSPYREGRRGKVSSLFTDLVGCAAGVDPLVVLREPPAEPHAPAPAASVAPEAEEDAPAAIAELERWDTSRRALEALAEGAGPSPRALDVVSWTGLLTYRDCPLKYRYRFQTRVADLLALEEPERVGERSVTEGVAVPKGMKPADYGVLVHEALSRVYGRGEEPADAVASAARLFGAAGVSNAAHASARSLVEGVLASEVGERGVDTATEQLFEVRLDTLVVHGVFDRVERGPGGRRVIDYKVGLENPAHEFQVELYAWALERIEGEEATGWLCYLREGGAHVKHVATRESAGAVGALARSLERSLAAGEFTATPGEVCGACAYRAVCPTAAP